MFAIINDDGLVIATSSAAADEENLNVSGLTQTPCENDVTGLFWNGKSFYSSFEKVQSNALFEIERNYETALLKAVDNPTEAERDTWPIKRECALAYQAGGATEAQQTSLTRYADARGQSVTDYVALVLAAADQHEQPAAYFEGIKTTAKAAITAASTIEEIETILSGIDWSYTTGD